MKTTVKLLLLMLISANAFAQEADQVLARVRYTYSDNADTLKTKKIRTENMILFIGKNTSLYTSYDKIRYELAEDQKSQARALARVSTSAVPQVIKIDRSAGEWLTKTNYNDTLTLSGVHCQKATALFEGKNWIAWFAASLPFQSGPWKLQGLPGLILEAYDENKSTQFQFAGRPGAHPGDINTLDVIMSLEVANAYFENKIQTPTYRTSKTTRKEYERLKAAYLKDPVGFSKTQYGF